MKNLLSLTAVCILSVLLISCESGTEFKFSFPTSAYYVFPQSVSFGLIPESEGDIHAWQMASISVQNFSAISSSSFADNYGYAGSIFNVGGEPKYIEYSKVIGADMFKNQGYIPERYGIEWEEPPFPYGSDVNFEFKYPNLEPVRDTVRMPLAFGSLRVDRDTMSLSYGCNIKWDNTDTEKVMLSIQMYHVPPLGGTPVNLGYGFIDYYENNGSLNFSKTLIDSIGITETVNYINFYMEKANLSFKRFNNGEKNAITMGHIQEITGVWVKP